MTDSGSVRCLACNCPSSPDIYRSFEAGCRKVGRKKKQQHCCLQRRQRVSSTVSVKMNETRQFPVEKASLRSIGFAGLNQQRPSPLGCSFLAPFGPPTWHTRVSRKLPPIFLSLRTMLHYVKSTCFSHGELRD